MSTEGCLIVRSIPRKQDNFQPVSWRKAGAPDGGPGTMTGHSVAGILGA